MPDPTLLMIPSPLVGPATWAGVAAWLGEQGRKARVVDTGHPRRPEDVLAAVRDAATGLGPVTLVPHSNAGLYVPALAQDVGVRATVFVDAALPGDDQETPMAPTPLMWRLRSLADADAVLPPWTRWWADDDLEDLFPDRETRREVEDGQPRLPLSYFTARLPVPPGWAERPCAYLAFGTTYADEIAAARAHGWPVAVVPGRHLHMLHDPAGVGAEILRLEGLLRA